ncbi:hypothetical protein Tco_0536512 [Tanacetum coccineum]
MSPNTIPVSPGFTSPPVDLTVWKTDLVCLGQMVELFLNIEKEQIFKIIWMKIFEVLFPRSCILGISSSAEGALSLSDSVVSVFFEYFDTDHTENLHLRSDCFTIRGLTVFVDIEFLPPVNRQQLVAFIHLILKKDTVLVKGFDKVESWDYNMGEWSFMVRRRQVLSLSGIGLNTVVVRHLALECDLCIEESHQPTLSVCRICQYQLRERDGMLVITYHAVCSCGLYPLSATSYPWRLPSAIKVSMGEWSNSSRSTLSVDLMDFRDDWWRSGPQLMTGLDDEKTSVKGRKKTGWSVTFQSV